MLILTHLEMFLMSNIWFNGTNKINKYLRKSDVSSDILTQYQMISVMTVYGYYCGTFVNLANHCEPIWPSNINYKQNTPDVSILENSEHSSAQLSTAISNIRG